MQDYRPRLRETWITKAQPVHIQGLEGGSLPYALQRLPLIDPTSQTLIICPGSKDAAQLTSDIQAIAPAGGNPVPVILFPAPDHLPYHPLTPSRDTWVARLKALNQWQSRQPLCCVAPVTAILRRLPPIEIFHQFGETIQPGSTMDLPAFQRGLVAMGYISSPLVEDPGSFSCRGGIIDIWSLAHDLPCRIELDGDIVASLRSFDPESQRSQNDIAALSIIPAHNLCFTNDDVPEISRRIKAASDAVDLPPGKRRPLVEALQQYRRLPVMETLLPCMYEKAATMPDYFSAATRIIIVNPAGIRTEAEGFTAKVATAYAETEDVDRIIPPEALYLSWPEFRKNFPEATCTIGGIAPSEGVEVIRVQTHLTTQYNMTTISPLLEKVRASGLRLVMTSHTPLQAERINDMLRWQGAAPIQHQGPLFASDIKAGAIVVAVNPLSAGFQWEDEQVLCITEEELFGRKLARRPKAAPPVEHFVSFADLSAGDHLVHTEHGIGRYQGLIHMTIQNQSSDYLLLEYLGGDKLYLPVTRMNLVQRYIGSDDSHPALDKLGGTRFAAAKGRAAKTIRVIAGELLKIYAERKLHKGFAFNPRDEALEQMEAAFPFDETPDQWEAIETVLADMQKEEPMDRLICGDVGFGKTEVAMRAAYRAVLDGKQVAVLVPTTILAYQHYQTFTNRLKDTGVRVDYLNRFVGRSGQKSVIAECAAGKVDILIGTHRLLQKDVQFRRLGLLIIDEEHRFGVSQKEKIRALRATVDTLAMSATPIPRTLHMSLSGLRDISVIRTPPADRQAIRTYISPFEDRIIREVILKELARGGQFFFVHNRVQTIFNMADHFQKTVPEARVVVAHGQMHEHELEKAMLAFTRKECDGLICTSIIESGLDIPSANTILVNRADTFGLSQLYQIRGRVGRSNVQAYAYLLTPPDREITEIASLRLATLQRFTDLGSGFSIAMHDLEIRGSGNLLGAQQSGHISEIGYEMFTQLLEQTIRELKGQAHVVEINPEIILPISAFLPETYISDARLRLVCYKKLSGVEDAAGLDALTTEWMDRFGPLPEPAQNLLHIMEIKLLAQEARLEQLQYDGSWLSLRLHETTPISPQKIMRLVQEKPAVYQIRPNSTFRIALPGMVGNQLFSEIRGIFRNVLNIP